MISEKTCPECGSRKITTKEAPYFGGVLIDYTCRECGYAWHQDVKKSLEWVKKIISNHM